MSSAEHEGPDHSFNENAPRPPVPGEETEVLPVFAGSRSPISNFSSWGPALKYKGGSSPVHTPRRSSLAYSGIEDGEAPLGFEPEGRCGDGEGSGGGSTVFVEVPGGSPPYVRWARNLHSLLEDPDGVELFRRYLEQEGKPHADTLNFWFACEGLKKQQDPDKITQLIRVIFRSFFLKAQLAISEPLRREVNRRIKEGGRDLGLAGDVFDAVQVEVENLINDTTYPNFLKSDLYLQHVNDAAGSSSGTSSEGTTSSGGSSSGGRGAGPPGGVLPTLHEDAELVTTAATGDSALPLTRDMLMVTQKRRALELRPRQEAYAGVYLPYSHHPYHHAPHPPHPAYSSYNPVSRQDSELQSVSSDARTDSDNLSLTDSSIDGMSGGRGRPSKKQYLRHCKLMKESASINRDPHMHHTVIPRTQRIQKEQLVDALVVLSSTAEDGEIEVQISVHPMNPDTFASILIDKLEAVKREQDAQEKLDRKLQEGEVAGPEEMGVLDPGVGPRTLADAIRDRLQVDDDNNDQAILDQHVSRVWSDLTPSRSPGLISPRPRSPEGRRRSAAGTVLPLGKMPSSGLIPALVSPTAAIPSSHFGNMGLIHNVPHPYQSHSRPSHYPRHGRKDKDVFSTFSSDSGNVHDFPEGSEHKLYLPKSKSMPEYPGDPQKQDLHSLTGHDGRYRQSREVSRRSSSSKKTLTDLTDSGVSMVSDSTPTLHPPAAPCKDSRVLSWLLESEKQGGPSGPHSHNDRDKHRLRAGTATSPIATRHSRKPVVPYTGSRSGSLERSSGTVSWGGTGPAQPFVADPCMPPLPLPHTPTQLEEARRRLLEEEGRARSSRQRLSLSSRSEAPQSGQSTLSRSGRGGSSDFTTVVFSFCDEQFPYRTKIPGRPVTLRQFKECLPKKGSYRYFFKTECEELDMRVIQEEIMDDNEVLPLWEGKVMAQVKPVE
uniref:Axin n=1 Tax=Timema bartmani TaxID=61472 RepID=A0A7R9HZ98_9NEOP|nr:unnamed protein product [Timema bartmani]